MSDSIPRPGRSVAVALGAAVLLALALVYAAIAALFGFLLSPSTLTIARVGETSLNLDFSGATIASIGEMRLNSEFSLNGLLMFGLLCLLSAYAGLGSIWRWPRWVSVARAAGWATILLGTYGIWTFLTIPGDRSPLTPVGITMPIHISLAAGVAGTLVLLAMRKPAASNP